MNYSLRLLTLALLAIITACQNLAAPTPTPTETATPTATATATATHTATHTPTPTQTPTITPTPTQTATPTVTLSPTIPPTPSITPVPVAQFVYDNWSLIEIPASIQGGINNPMIAFINLNDRESATSALTPQPSTNLEVLYFGSATNPGVRTSILELSAGTGDQVYVAPAGNAVAYFKPDPTGQTTGLYILDVSVGISGRVITMTSMLQGGFFSQPSWSPDGTQLAISLENGYATDIYTMGRDGTNITNITQSGAYNVWPSWSPDGRYLLFVSDRMRCSSWVPGTPGGCDALTELPPDGGHTFIYDTVNNETRQISEQWVTESPRWVNARQVALSSGEPAFGDPERTLYLVDIISNQEKAVRMVPGPEQQINLAEVWSPDGLNVIFQDASGTSNPVVMMTGDGTVIGRNTDLNFPRFGMSAAWSPDGTRVAIGGVGGNCPYGARVMDNNFTPVATGNPPPSMCDPVYSPNGQQLAFTGVRPQIDGRVDIYVANNNGFSATNITGDLRGQIRLLGWVGN